MFPVSPLRHGAERRATSPVNGGGQKSLIVTADDFGLACQVNEAVERAHREGVLTTASLMVAAPAAAEAVTIARRNPGLRVGLHLVLVDGSPVLPVERVRHLVERVHSVHSVHPVLRVHLPPASVEPDSPDSPDSTSKPDSPDSPDSISGVRSNAFDADEVHSAHSVFRTDMVGAGFTLFFHPAARRELAAEIEAQFAAYASTGLSLDHVTTHKHFHLHPTIAGLILRVGRRYGLRASRTPLEPPGLLAAAEPGFRPAPALVTAPWARLVQARFRRAGVFTPDRVLGLRWSGAMTEARVAALIERLPSGVTELYGHPAIAGGFPGAASGYRYAEELAALTSTRVAQAVRRSGATLGGFSDFAGQIVAGTGLAGGARAPTSASIAPVRAEEKA